MRHSNKAIKVTYAGITYPSINALARAYKMTPDTAKARLKSGIPLEAPKNTSGKALDPEVSKRHPWRKFTPSYFTKNHVTKDQEKVLEKINGR